MKKTDAPFSIDFIASLLPHEHPFIMVDALYSYTESSLVSGFSIAADNILVQKGIFTESGLIEHMAQSVALHTGYQFYLKQQAAPTGYIGAIKNIIITKLPSIGDKIESEVTILQEFAGVTLVNISTRLNSNEIASGQMKTVLA